MKQPDRHRAGRAWSLLVAWLFVIVLTSVSFAPASAAWTDDGQRVAAGVPLPAAGPLGHPALGDHPFEHAHGPAVPANIDENERERQASSSMPLDCLPSIGISITFHSSAEPRHEDAWLPAYWVTYGVRDLRGPPVA